MAQMAQARSRTAKGRVIRVGLPSRKELVGELCRYEARTVLLGSGIVGDIAARREFAADATWRSRRPTRVLPWIPTSFQQTTCS